MPQEMTVLCCYSCKMFQVHIAKKTCKWQCKLCNAKQSIQQIYLQGSGKDCRQYVQQLNSLKVNDVFALISEQNNINNYSSCTRIFHKSYTDKAIESKWAKYLVSVEKERLSDTRNLVSDEIRGAEDVRPGEECDEMDDVSHNFENILDDSNFETGNTADGITDASENLPSTSSQRHSDSGDKCDLQVNSKLNVNCNDVISIFETNEKLDDPLDF